MAAESVVCWWCGVYKVSRFAQILIPQIQICPQAPSLVAVLDRLPHARLRTHLSVIDVADGANVDVRLGPLERGIPDKRRGDSLLAARGEERAGGAASPEGVARRAQEGREGSYGGRHGCLLACLLPVAE